MWARKIIFLSLITSGLLAVTLLYGFLVGSTCQYSISIYVPDDDRDVLLTCYRGKVVALQTKRADDGHIISKWRVEARQLRFGQQTVYFVYSRTPLVTGVHHDDSNDRFNQISSGYNFLFYKIIRVDNEALIFQNFPRNYVHKAKIEGFLDFWDMWRQQGEQ
jgi:hypothetical protein